MNMRAKRTLALILSLSLGLLAFAGCSSAPAAAPGSGMKEVKFNTNAPAQIISRMSTLPKPKA